VKHVPMAGPTQGRPTEGGRGYKPVTHSHEWQMTDPEHPFTRYAIGVELTSLFVLKHIRKPFLLA
jgi:hypothetical protein